MRKTLFIGDINVDVIMGGLECFPIPDREITCQSFDVAPGSSAVIAAAAYAALGGDSSLLGLAGTDAYGDFMIQEMTALGIRADLVRRTRETRTGVTVNLILGSQRTQVTYPGTIAEFRGDDIDAETLRPFHHVHFTGPYQQTRFRPDIGRLLALCQRMGITTSLDPQWDVRERWEHMDQWLPLLTWFFPNQDEAQSIARASSPEEACLALASRTHCPAVKSGPRGAVVCVDGKPRWVAPVDVQVADTTGAGDSFDAGFLFAVLEEKMDVLGAARFANAVAARSCMFVGGVTARSTHADVVALLEKRP
ncbi:MAG: carbohydrate kinase family protein [Candidatus Sumerlaeota bacterium]|nr:carbohydrate kinase family protein [Candidatus Sumerlaeota bacterium]